MNGPNSSPPSAVPRASTPVCEVLLGEWMEINPATGEPVDARFIFLWRDASQAHLLGLLQAEIEIISFRAQ